MTHTVTITAAPMGSPARPMRWVFAGVALAALAACQPKDPPTPTAVAPTTAPATAPAPVVYIPPSADALYQMVAPIALYPDKLVALALAGAIHPDEVSSAYNWLAQNPTVAANVVNQQPWDPSIKALTAFPNALNLLQSNLPWTTALGQAYNNDPADVLNAVQVMRQRAQQAGHLQSNAQQRVVSATARSDYTPNTVATAVYSGPAIVPPPAAYIAIEPAQAQTVYVPSYDPGAVYGAPVAYYEGYRYHPPVVSSVSPVAIGALAFGAGVAITAAMEHHDWGWNAWGVHWGDAPRQAQWHPGDAPLPPAARPAVTYRQSTYVSHVNNVVNNYRSVDSHNTTIYNNAAAPTAPTGPTAAPPQANGIPATAPTHHGQAMLAGAAAGTALGAMALHHGANTAVAMVPSPAAAANAPAAPYARPGERMPATPSLPRSAPSATGAPPPAMATATPAPQAGHRAGLNLPMPQTAVQPHAIAPAAPATGTGLQVPHGAHGTSIPTAAPAPASAPQPVSPHPAPVLPPHPTPIAAVAHTPPPPPAPPRPVLMAAPRPAPVTVAPHVQAPPPPPPRPVRASPPPPAPQQHAAAPHEAPSRHKDEHSH